MTNLTISTVRSTATVQIKSIDWATHQRRAKAIALTVATMLYLTFLAARATYRLGMTARALWLKYELSAKIAAAVVALKTEFDAIAPLSVRVDEVRDFADNFKVQALDFSELVKAEAKAITGK